MAGSFGYSVEHFDVSRQIGERRLFPAVRNSAPGTTIVAPGFSCRHQIRDFTGATAVHPAIYCNPSWRAGMSLAALSLFALFFTIFLSCVTKLNVGVLAIAMAWIIGVYGWAISVEQIASGFPVQLFLTLVGMTLLFSQAQVNGTFDKLAHKAVRVCRGNAGVIPIMFFFVAVGLASMGPGQHCLSGFDGSACDGSRRSREGSGVPHGDHGRQWRECRIAVAICAHWNYRERPHGQNRHVRVWDGRFFGPTWRLMPSLRLSPIVLFGGLRLFALRSNLGHDSPAVSDADPSTGTIGLLLP